jgi:hypothetical protein
MSPLQGSCQCGGVAFVVSEPFSRLSFCHCTTCKKISGGVGTANGRAPTEAVRITRGADLIQTYQPDEGSAKTFCARCGSNLFGGGWPESERTSVRLSAVDSQFPERPEAHIYVRSVAAWETLPDDGLERYEAERAS